jgi:hypothetical protein
MWIYFHLKPRHFSLINFSKHKYEETFSSHFWTAVHADSNQLRGQHSHDATASESQNRMLRLQVRRPMLAQQAVRRRLQLLLREINHDFPD